MLSFAFLVVFVLVIEEYFDWGSLLQPWTELSPLMTGGVLFLLFATYLARGMRLHRYYAGELDFLICLKLLLQHNLWIVLLPARTGEAAFPLLMHRYFRITPRQSIPVLLWFRLLDLHALALVVACAFLWRTSPVTALYFAVAWNGLLFATLLCRPAVIRHLDSRQGRIALKLRELLGSAPASMAKLVESWAWTLVCWVTKLLLFAWIIRAFTSLNFLPSLAGAVGGEVSSALPIHSIGGFGTYHTGVASALIPFGATVEEAIQSGVNLHLVVFGGALASGLLAYAIPRNRAKSVQRFA